MAETKFAVYMRVERVVQCVRVIAPVRLGCARGDVMMWEGCCARDDARVCPHLATRVWDCRKIPINSTDYCGNPDFDLIIINIE